MGLVLFGSLAGSVAPADEKAPAGGGERPAASAADALPRFGPFRP
jgi:hypothetical protein